MLLGQVVQCSYNVCLCPQEPRLLAAKSNVLLTAIMHGMRKEEPRCVCVCVCFATCVCWRTVVLSPPLHAVCASVCPVLRLSAMHLSSQVQTLRRRCVCHWCRGLLGHWLCCCLLLFLTTHSFPPLPLPVPPLSQNERHYIMQVVCEATQCAEEPRVRRGLRGKVVPVLLPAGAGITCVCVCGVCCVWCVMCVVCDVCGV